MGTPHKHAAIIKAWADGKDIEFLDTLPREPLWREASRPSWSLDTEYRVKPEGDTVVHGVVERYYHLGQNAPRAALTNTGTYRDACDNVRFIFDGETGKLKSAEVLK